MHDGVHHALPAVEAVKPCGQKVYAKAMLLRDKTSHPNRFCLGQEESNPLVLGWSSLWLMLSEPDIGL